MSKDNPEPIPLEIKNLMDNIMTGELSSLTLKDVLICKNYFLKLEEEKAGDFSDQLSAIDVAESTLEIQAKINHPLKSSEEDVSKRRPRRSRRLVLFFFFFSSVYIELINS